MFALGHGDEILQLEVIAMRSRRQSPAAAARENARHSKARRGAGQYAISGNRADGRRVGVGAAVLKPRLVDNAVTDDLRIVELQCVLGGIGRIGNAGKRCGTAQIVGRVCALELVAQGERVLLAQLQVDTRRYLKMIGRIEETARYRSGADRPGIRGRVVYRPIDDREHIVGL